MYLEIGQLSTANVNASVNEVSFSMDSIKKNKLDYTPWEQYNYFPAVHFSIAYCDEFIFLKYYVAEKFMLAVNSLPNTPVYEDCCVEFFLSFDDEKAYYNFEFNCIGTALAGYGETKTERVLLPELLINQIKYQSVINNYQVKNDKYWELTLVIPKSLFCYNKIETFKGKRCRANFYKCGDKLPIPHFVSWSNIKSQEPNFHLPDFFGNLYFL
jgi:Carbohydrate-binding family 9